jgi:uncharacterized protein (DUF433 family)
MIDWSQCEDVESVPDRCGGQPVVKGTRLPVQAILDNAEDCSADEIATEIFPSVPVEIVQRILAFAGVTPLDYSDIPPLDDEFFATAKRAQPLLLCLDFEASGSGPRGYPIEVAIADVVTGAAREWLIAPTPAWLETGVWDAEAEAVHGISLTEIIAYGRGVGDVAAELTAQTRGAQVLSDAPTFDTKWLRDLYRATGAEPPFELLDFHQIAWREAVRRGRRRGRRPDMAIVKAEAEAYALFPNQHRAGPDARRNAEMLRQIQRLLP